jgi:protein gp37
MADSTKIEWSDATINPIRARRRDNGRVGHHCVHKSAGCQFCYAERMNLRLGTGLPFKPGHERDIELFLDEKALTQPLRWRKPRMIFLCSMTDLFADFVPDEWIDKIFAVMAMSPRHTYQVLTKRPDRMRRYFEERRAGDPWAEAADAVAEMIDLEDHPHVLEPKHIPLGNAWLGVSAEDQRTSDERIPDLLATPAAVRWVSAEPLIGPIDFMGLVAQPMGETITDALQGVIGHNIGADEEGRVEWDGADPCAKLDWIVVGGESGPKARSMHPDWVRSIRDQCSLNGIPFFFKQWGEWMPSTREKADANGNYNAGWRSLSGRSPSNASELYPEAGAAFVERVGKKQAGRSLDGVVHDGFPTTEVALA